MEKFCARILRQLLNPIAPKQKESFEEGIRQRNQNKRPNRPWFARDRTDKVALTVSFQE